MTQFAGSSPPQEENTQYGSVTSSIRAFKYFTKFETVSELFSAGKKHF